MVAPGELPEHLASEPFRFGGGTPIERNGGQPEAGFRSTAKPLEDRSRLVEASLPPTEVREAEQGQRNPARPEQRQFRDRRGQLGLRRRPIATRDEDPGVLSPADGKQGRMIPTAAVFLDPATPLVRPVEVADQFAGGDQVTAGDAGRAPIGEIAGDHCGGGLVELRHALGHLARRHQRQPLKGQSEELQVGIMEAPA